MNFFSKKPKRLFLDHASTTPVDPEVLDVMMRYQKENFGNPSALYTEALNAKSALKESRKKIADLLNAQQAEIVFTGGGTEGNNMALLGIFEQYKTKNPPTGRAGFTPHIITTTIEHPSVLEVCDEIEKRGGEVTRVVVSKDGIVNPKDIALAMKPNTVLVSVMYANNEIGVIQDVSEIGKVVKAWRNKNKNDFPYFHTDACQAGLHLSLDTIRLGVDLLTLDGIKMYGPRGSGILYVKNGLELKPIQFGGGQEKNLKSGTENVASCLGLAKALEIAEKMKKGESERLAEIRDFAIEEITKSFPGSELNGSKENRLPNNVNICFPGLDAEFAVISLDVAGICASYSSSCKTLKEDSSSSVIKALGKESCSSSSLRFTFGRETKIGDIDILISALKKIVIK